MASKASVLGNALLFQLGWFVCVLGGDRVALPVIVVALLMHALFFCRERSEWLCMALCVLLGVAVDSALHAVSILQFTTVTVGVPPWLIALWLLFAMTLNHSLQWLQTRLRIAALLGAVAGPLSYWGGVKLGAAQFGATLTTALLVLACCWAWLLPLLSAMMCHRHRILPL